MPTEGSDRPPRLRFGRPYRFALAAVYSGGLSVPKEEFPFADGSDRPAEDLYYPSDGMARAVATEAGGVIRPYVRALRQAKIGAPQTLVPHGHATRANGPMGPDTAGLMVVRSLDADAAASSDRKLASRAVPVVSQRIVVVPSVPQDRAVAHADWRANSDRRGLLDGPSHLRDGPPMGTFRNVRHRGPSATFPAIRTSHLKGLTVASISSRAASSTTRKPKPWRKATFRTGRSSPPRAGTRASTIPTPPPGISRCG